MALAEHSILDPLFDLIRIKQDRYFQITTACDAILIVGIAFLSTNPFNLSLCNIGDGEGSHISLAHLDLHEHTIRPKHYERDSRFIFAATSALLCILASIPIQRGRLNKATHAIFMLASALVAVLLAVFAYLSKSTQSHSVTNQCTAAWYILAALTIVLSTNRLVFYLSMRAILFDKKKP
jgi:heme/copper-type cytochrome/quinol oxidase subunit 4